MKKAVHTSGKRKRAIARATIREGNGIVRINGQSLDAFNFPLSKMKIQEPLLLAGDLANKVDISVNWKGGGVSSGADAIRLAIAKALVEFSKDKKLEKEFLNYDRHLLIADIRRKEPCKPNDSKARAKRQKSYR